MKTIRFTPLAPRVQVVRLDGSEFGHIVQTSHGWEPSNYLRARAVRNFRKLLKHHYESVADVAAHLEEITA